MSCLPALVCRIEDIQVCFLQLAVLGVCAVFHVQASDASGAAYNVCQCACVQERKHTHVHLWGMWYSRTWLVLVSAMPDAGDAAHHIIIIRLPV